MNVILYQSSVKHETQVVLHYLWIASLNQQLTAGLFVHSPPPLRSDTWWFGS